MKIIKTIHSQEYIERMKNFKSKSFVCRKCSEKIYLKKKTIEEALEINNKCSRCKNELDLDNLYCYASIDTYYTYQTYQIALEAVGVVKIY